MGVNHDRFTAPKRGIPRSQWVRDTVAKDPIWQKLGRTSGPTRDEYNKALSLKGIEGTGQAEVAYTDRDPRAAHAAVEAIIRASREAYDDDASHRRTVSRWEETAKAHRQRIEHAKSERTRVLGSYGSADLAALWRSSPSRRAQIEADQRKLWELDQQAYYASRGLAEAGVVIDRFRNRQPRDLDDMLHVITPPTVPVTPSNTRRRITVVTGSAVAGALLLGIAALMPAVARAAARRVRRRRTTPGHYCGHCGYDLRATPQRCPECGGPAAH